MTVLYAFWTYPKPLSLSLSLIPTMVVWPNLVNWLIMFCNGCLMEFIVYSLVLHPQKHCSSIVRVKNTLSARKLVRSFQRRVVFDLVKIKNSYAWLLKFCLANVTEKCKFQRHSKELEVLSKQRIFLSSCRLSCLSRYWELPVTFTWAWSLRKFTGLEWTFVNALS